MTSNEDYVFKNFIEKPEDYMGHLKEAGLSINHISKERFAQAMYDYGLTTEQAGGTWKFLCEKVNEAWDQHLLSQRDPLPLTRENLKAMKIEPGTWYEKAKELGIDIDLAESLFSDYCDEVRSVLVDRIEASEQAQEEAQAQAEARSEEWSVISKEQAQLLLTQIMNDKSHPYWSETASVSEHELAVAGVLRLREIIAGKEQTLDGYAEQHIAERNERLKENYGVSGDLHKGNQFKSSNSVPPSRSENDRGLPPDAPYKNADRSSASGGRIEDAE